MYSWEPPGLPSYFLDHLVSPAGNGQDSLLPLVVFAVYLASTWVSEELQESQSSREPKLHVLLSAAARGCQAARAVVPSAFAFYKQAIPAGFDAEVRPWLESASASGSNLARRYLEQLCPDALPNCIQEFKRGGGYGVYYTAPPPSGSLAWIAAYGTPDQLRDHYSLNPTAEVDINEKTPDGETPLYLSCVRGSWEMAAELLNHGADASIACAAFQATCLHWLFAFDPADQYLAAKQLIDSGAQINAMVPEVVPFPHYPFTLPAGTPLHWAVATLSHPAIQVLVDLGADLHIRDGTDSYSHDPRIHVFSFGGKPTDSDTPIQGLTPLDHAAMEHDPYIFEHLVSTQRAVDINATDEQGLTVLHRLSSHHGRRTRTGTWFSSLPFKVGNAPTNSGVWHPHPLWRTVTAIKSLGGNMEQPSTSRTGSIRRSIGSLTPLAMAAMGGRADVVAALLDAGGANIHTENELGRTAINLPCDDHVAAYEITRLLIAAGADIGHRSRTGNTILCSAAYGSMIAVMELLLEHGADVEEVCADPRNLLCGRGVFAIALTTRLDKPFDESTDIRLAGMLVKYVLGAHVDGGTRRRVVENADGQQEVLLHRYASRSMRH
jgi:ankyrin repeat protein